MDDDRFGWMDDMLRNQDAVDSAKVQAEADRRQAANATYQRNLEVMRQIVPLALPKFVACRDAIVKRGARADLRGPALDDRGTSQSHGPPGLSFQEGESHLPRVGGTIWLGAYYRDGGPNWISLGPPYNVRRFRPPWVSELSYWNGAGTSMGQHVTRSDFNWLTDSIDDRLTEFVENFIRGRTAHGGW